MQREACVSMTIAAPIDASVRIIANQEPPMRPYDPNFREFPKWVGDVLVHSREEERKIITAAAVEVPEAAPPEPEPARPVSSATEMHPTPSLASSASVRPPSSASIRMARMRDRQRNDRRVITLEVTATQIATLVQAGVLDAALRDDAAEVALGVGRLLDCHAARNSVTPAPAPAGCN
jgi:hypothetical protein